MNDRFGFLYPSLALPRRGLLKAVLAAAVAGASLAACNDSSDDSSRWAASWYAAQADRQEALIPAFPAPAPKSVSDQTLRQIVYVSAAGSQVRLKFSNLFGDAPVTLDAVSIAARSGSAGGIDPSTSRPVTFGGAASLTMAPGTEAFSDTVDFPVAANSTVAVSTYVRNTTPLRTEHHLARQLSYVAAGNVTTAATPAWTQINDTPPSANGGSTAWLTELDVLRGDSPKVIVAFGDSITDGYGSTQDANNRWPNILSRIVAADPATYGPTSVVDAGISGNRWKNDVIGPKGEGRFQRDVLDVSGATHTVILLGINDIGFEQFAPAQVVPASAVTAAIQTAVDQAKARGLKVLVGTLTPFKPTPIYYTDAREAKRQAVNDFIRKSLKNADAVVDFDQALADPANPLQMRPAYDFGDNLHPNDAGYQAMAQTVAATLRSMK